MMGSPSGAGECEEEERPASPADEEIDRSKGKETESEENEQVQVYDDNMLEAKKQKIMITLFLNIECNDQSLLESLYNLGDDHDSNEKVHWKWE